MTATGKKSAQLDLPFIVICGQYRGGSTLLMRIFNEHEGVTLRGENQMAVEHLVRFYQQSSKLQQEPDYAERLANGGWFPALFNSFSDTDMRESLNQVLASLCGGGLGEKARGYKEIRHGLPLPHALPLSAFVHGLSAITQERARFIFLEREIESMIQSIVRADWESNEDLDGFRTRMRSQQLAFRELAKSNPECCRLISYQDAVEGNSRLAEAVGFTGIEFDKDAWQRAAAVRLK